MSNDIHNDNWIEEVKQKATSATRDVPQGTWDAIAKSLPQQATIAPQRGRIAPRMWKAVAAAAAVAIVATTGFFLLNNEESSTEQHLAENTPLAPKVQEQTPAETSPSQQESDLESTTPILAQNTPRASQASSVHHRHHTVSTNSSATHHSHHGTSQEYVLPQDYEQEPYSDEDEQLAYNEDEFNPDEYFYDIETMQALEELYAEYDNAMNQEAMEPWRNYSDSTYHQHLAYDANARRIAREQMALPRSKQKPELLMAAYGNGLISSDRNSTVTSSSAQFMSAPAAPGMMMAPAAPGMSQNVSMPVNYSYHHHMPLTVGLTFTKRIVGNLYGNLGLNFTSMNSDVTPDNGTAEFKQNIKLIGVPFGVRWNFWRYKGLTTFVGGEGLMERVVDASFGKEDITIKRLQWSVHATAGVQYNFNKHVGIYLEPKLSHYITTLPLNTQRNEHPFNFNLQMGLSLDF